MCRSPIMARMDLIEREDIHLAIFDIMMPKMDGVTLTKYVRQIKNMPILILTAKIGGYPGPGAGYLPCKMA